MVKQYGQANVEEAECIVVLSGDGMVLKAFHEHFDRKIPVYGMNRGKTGFLTNKYSKENLTEKIQQALEVKFHPLRIIIEKKNGETFSDIAINEVYLLRETHQSAKIAIKVDGVLRMQELICDGLITASQIGSTAYNYSAHGPIIPVGFQLMTLTPISPFRPRNWRGAVLPSETILDFEVLDGARRPVCAVADYIEFRQAVNVKVFEDRTVTLSLLLDKNNSLESKTLNEQFTT
jgi:NAD+ kinase